MQQPALPSDQIRVQQGVYLFSALGGGVLHGTAAADHQLAGVRGTVVLVHKTSYVGQKCGY